MSIYLGRRSGPRCCVTVEGKPLPPRLDLRSLSGTFEWGYEGTAPAQLAVAILAREVGDTAAQLHHQDFQRAVVARLPAKGWALTGKEVAEWVAAWHLETARRGVNKCDAWQTEPAPRGQVIAFPGPTQ